MASNLIRKEEGGRVLKSVESRHSKMTVLARMLKDIKEHLDANFMVEQEETEERQDLVAELDELIGKAAVRSKKLLELYVPDLPATVQAQLRNLEALRKMQAANKKAREEGAF